MVGHVGVKSCFIYVLTDPRRNDEVRYVGKSTYPAPKTRLNQHVHKAKNNCTTWRDSWIRAVLADDVRPGICEVERGDWSAAELDAAECKWVAEYLERGARLTNHTDGGDGGAMPPDVAARTGAKLRGRKATPEQRAAQSARQTGMKRSPEARANMSAAQRKVNLERPEVAAERGRRQRGRIVSEETRKKQAEASRGRPASPAARATAATMAEKRWKRARAEGRARPKFEDVFCENCGKTFTADLGRRRTCSSACRYELVWKQRRARGTDLRSEAPFMPGEARECVGCHVWFTVKSRTQRSCGKSECRGVAISLAKTGKPRRANRPK